MSARPIKNIEKSILLLLVPFAVLPILGTLKTPFLMSYDDYFATSHNPLVVHGWSYLPALFIRGAAEQGHMQLAYMSLALDHAIFGDFAGGYRLMNALIHAQCGFLVYKIAARLMQFSYGAAAPDDAVKTSAAHAALLSAFVFTAHPACVETVSWVIQRNNALAQLFGLLSILVYLQAGAGVLDGGAFCGPRWPRLLAAAALLLCAQLSKTAAAGLFIVFAAFELWLCEGSRVQRGLRAFVMSLPCLGGALMCLAAHGDQLVAPVGGNSIFGRIAGMLYLHGRAWMLALYPANLSAFYHVPPEVSFANVFVALAVAIPCVWILIYRGLGLPRRRVLILLAWAVAGFLPAMNPFWGISFALQDRYVYLSLPPVCMLLSEVLIGVTQPKFAGLASFKPALACSLVCILGGGAALRSLAWKRESILFLDAATKQPDGAFGHAYLASYLFDSAARMPASAGRQHILERSLQEHERALECDDFERLVYPLHHLNEQASLYLALGKTDAARALFQRVWSGREERPPERGAKLNALRFLADDALNAKRFDECLRLSNAGLVLQPDQPRLLENRVLALEGLGRVEEARTEAQRLLARPATERAMQTVLKRLDAAKPKPK